MVGYRMQAPEIEFIVDRRMPTVDFFPRVRRSYHALPGQLHQGLPRWIHLLGGPTPEGATDYEDLFVDPPELDLDNLQPAQEAGHSMVYTSGTTGHPKGAARSTDFITKEGVLDYLFESIRFFKLAEDEVHLVCCPYYHSGPGYLAILTYILGGTLTYTQFDAVGFLELVEKYRVTSTHLVPTMVTRLLDVSQEVSERLDLSSLRSVVCGAAPLFPQYKMAFLDRFGPVLHEYYGATETGLPIPPLPLRRCGNTRAVWVGPSPTMS